LDYLDRFSWKSSVSNFPEIRLMGAALTCRRTNRQTSGHDEGYTWFP